MLRRAASATRQLSSGAKTAPAAPRLNELHTKWLPRWKTSFGGLLHPPKPPQHAKPFYCLTMFPYPLGILHLGHQRVYTISDVISRYKRLQGHDVIHPMGWDAFGLPAENAAVERGVNPADWTVNNIARMKAQMELMLADFDWLREVDTLLPEYYRWTQKIFTLLFERGLVYRMGAEINWDPVDETVLANEQVDADGRSWRLGALVEKRNLEQWFIGITQYADALNADLAKLPDWPAKVKAMQRHWIGKSVGAEVVFPASTGASIVVYTSRPETLFSVQFVALALDHPLVAEAAQKDAKLALFVKAECELSCEPGLSKAGYELDFRVSIPITVDGEKTHTFDVPVYAAPYVLGSYGHGAVMGCPAHDQRDADFWALHKPGTPVRPTVGDVDLFEARNCTQVYTSKEGKLYDSTVLANGVSLLGKYYGMSCLDARQQLVADLSAAGCGSPSTQFRIRDWLISRQRYWGAPIPIIHCNSCGPVAVPDKDLPVLLPPVEGKNFGKGNPLGTIDSFVNTSCPSCGSPAKRDTDTMDTFIDSSWYFFRYADPKNTERPFDHDLASKCIPVDIYTGGVEHAILHLLYSRFMAKFLGDCGLWDGKDSHFEPIKKLVTQGMVHGKTFSDPDTGRFLKPEELEVSGSDGPVVKSSGKKPKVSFEKMSKSKYNGVDPSTLTATHGADAVRAQILFAAPVSDVLNWSEEQILGTERWLRKVINLQNAISGKINGSTSSSEAETGIAFQNLEINREVHPLIRLNNQELELFNQVHTYANKIAQSIEVDLSLNTIISDLMKLTNYLAQALKENQNIRPAILMDSYKKLLIIMSPVTPSVAEECWELLCTASNEKWESIMWQKYPTQQPLVSPQKTFNVIVNGKKVQALTVEQDLLQMGDADLLVVLRQNAKVRQHIGEKHVHKVIAKKGVISIICK